MNEDRLSHIIKAALSGDSTLVVKNANVVNVFTKEIMHADVAVYDDTIIGVGSFSGKNEYDAHGAYLCPGFIDAHVHIESSMVTPASFSDIVLEHGTCAVIADPHEIANVFGAAGVRAMRSLSDGVPLDVRFMTPSCVPATKLETSGASLSAEDMAQLIAQGVTAGLGEVMDFGAVARCEPDMLKKLSLFDGKIVDGHAPMMSGLMLNAYRAAGPATDHEFSTFGEFIEKLRVGMYMLLRVGSAANDIGAILTRIARDKLPTDRLMFCTDDKHIEHIMREGHINAIARLAVKCGISPVDAVCMASCNAARAYGINDMGAIAPGYRATMVLFDDLEEFSVRDVFVSGKPYKRPAHAAAPRCFAEIPQFYDSVRYAPLTAESFSLFTDEYADVIKLKDGTLVTELVKRRVNTENGVYMPTARLNKLAVIERHRATGSMSVALVEGFGLAGGAIASSVGHDSHNIIVVGDNDSDMLAAVDALKTCGGGYCAVRGGKTAAILALPIAGLMTDAPISQVIQRQHELLNAAKLMGAYGASDPLITLSFLALPVIPRVRLTDIGLFDAAEQRFIYVGNGRKKQ